MSQRAAWQLEELGFSDVYDFVVGKAFWLASGRPTIRAHRIDRVGDHLTDAMTGRLDESADRAGYRTLDDEADLIVLGENDVVLGRVRPVDLAAAESAATLGDIMRVGPTTVRPERIITRALEFARDTATAYERCSDHDRHELNHAWFDAIYVDDLEPVEGELLPAMAALLDPELPRKLQTQNTAYQDDPTGIDWDHVIDQINRADTAQDHGSKVPLMVGTEGLEPPTSSL